MHDAAEKAVIQACAQLLERGCRVDLKNNEGLGAAAGGPRVQQGDTESFSSLGAGAAGGWAPDGRDG